MLRAINYALLFEDYDDNIFFLNTLEHFAKENNISIYAYALMDNHVHLLVRGNNESLARFMKQISVKYAAYFNKKNMRTGNLFQGRFRSEAVENDPYFLTVLRYIHQNPLKAGIVTRLEQYKWSSYKTYVATTQENDFLDTSFALEMFKGDKKSFALFNAEANSYFAQKIEPKKRKITDHEIINILKKDFHLNPSSFLELPKDKQRNILRILLNKNASAFQLSRVLSLPRRFVLNTQSVQRGLSPLHSNLH